MKLGFTTLHEQISQNMILQSSAWRYIKTWVLDNLGGPWYPVRDLILPPLTSGDSDRFEHRVLWYWWFLQPAIPRSLDQHFADICSQAPAHHRLELKQDLDDSGDVPPLLGTMQLQRLLHTEGDPRLKSLVFSGTKLHSLQPTSPSKEVASFVLLGKLSWWCQQNQLRWLDLSKVCHNTRIHSHGPQIPDQEGIRPPWDSASDLNYTWSSTTVETRWESASLRAVFTITG